MQEGERTPNRKEDNVATPTVERATYHRHPWYSLSFDAMHPWPVLSVVHGGESRGAPCPGRELFAVNGGGRCRRKCPTPKLYSEQPIARRQPILGAGSWTTTYVYSGRHDELGRTGLTKSVGKKRDNYSTERLPKNQHLFVVRI